MSKSDVTPSSLGVRKCPSICKCGNHTPEPVAAPVCDHFWVWKSPAGTSHGVEICEYCHQPNPQDLERLAALGTEGAFNE